MAISAAVLFLIGSILFAGGGYLLSLGGSPYYMVAGVALLASAWLYWRKRRAGERIYAVVLLATLAWALFESGSNPWALGARTFAPAVLGLWLAAPWVRHGLRDASPMIWRSEAGLSSMLVLVAIVVSFAKYQHVADVDAPPSRFDAATATIMDSDWPNYGNSLGGERYVPFSQINTANVHKLQVAWIHRSGLPWRTVEVTPIKIADTLYTCGQDSMVYALDARTGRERWRSDPYAKKGKHPASHCRGVSFYHQPNGSGPCADSVIFAVPGSLRAIDAGNGVPCPGFGTRGSVSLLDNMGDVDPALYFTSSPPLVVAGLAIVNSKMADSRNQDTPSGVIKAFDARTGALRWAWDMGAPNRIGAPAPGETFTRSTPNSWAPMSADEALGLLYVPMGNPSLDFYGVNRRPFDEKFGTALVALNISDGRPRWSFQTVRHDLWDYDLPAQPMLIDLPGPAGVRPAVVQPTKQGHLFVLDRRDGALIFPAAPRVVPGGAVDGEKLSPTQIFPSISLTPKPLSEADMWGATPIDQLWCRIAFRRARYEGLFTPPGVRTTIQYPGSQGVFEWGGISADVDAGIVIANTTDFPWTARLIPRRDAPEVHGYDVKRQLFEQRNSPYALKSEPFLGPLRMPCKQPPWGKLAAIDLKTGKVRWRNPIGTARDTGPLGSSVGLPLMIGQVNLGGSLTTRGGVTFIAATLDRYLRAYDVQSGRELARIRLPAGGQATPMSYMAGGKQYVVITAGGNAFLGTKGGDYTIAYALADADIRRR